MREGKLITTHSVRATQCNRLLWRLHYSFGIRAPNPCRCICIGIKCKIVKTYKQNWIKNPKGESI